MHHLSPMSGLLASFLLRAVSLPYASRSSAPLGLGVPPLRSIHRGLPAHLLTDGWGTPGDRTACGKHVAHLPSEKVVSLLETASGGAGVGAASVWPFP